ncbi:MAG: hypothetical protein IKB25_11180 [Lentisphaeria bacterium]|nr:hypothetical protein [Lentisphaeria bacterium]
MPEQDDRNNLDYISTSGFFTFSAIGVLLYSVFYGNFAELIPVFLIFFFAMMLGSCFGKKTDSLPVRYCELLFGFAALFFFRESECFALISGFLAGCISTEAFGRIPSAEKRKIYYRHYLYSGIFAVFLFYWIGFWVIPVAAFSHAVTVLFRKKKKLINLCACLFLFLLLPSLYYLSGRFQKERPVPKRANIPESVRVGTAISQTSDASDGIFFIYPSGSKSELVKVFTNYEPYKSKARPLPYDSFGNIMSDVQKSDERPSDAIIELNPGNSTLMGREFIGHLKEKLRTECKVIYFLPDNDPVQVAALRAALAKEFRYTRTAGAIAMVLASDKPLDIPETQQRERILEELLYPSEFEKLTDGMSRKTVIPSYYGYAWERWMMGRSGNLIQKLYAKYLPLSSTVFCSLLAGLIILYIVLRYTMAYIPGMGLRLTVYRDCVLIFSVPGILLFAKSLTLSSEPIAYMGVLAVFALAASSGTKIPVKFAPCVVFCALALIAVSCFVMRCPYALFYVHILMLTAAAGALFPLMLQGSLEKYKTGTNGEINLFPVVCSGLITTAVLLAVMPDHLYFGSMLP